MSMLNRAKASVKRINSEKAAQSCRFGMSTVITHKAFGKQAEEAVRCAETETARLERMLSRFVAGSEVSRINASAGNKAEKVSDETFEVISKAAGFSKLCEGCFDVTIGPLTALWSKAKDMLKPPGDVEIKRILPLVNYSDLILEPSRQEVGLKKDRQSINLGGIGKGYAADRILEVFKEYGITSAFTDFGGNVAVIGAKPDGSPWRVGIRNPRKENDLIAAISVIGRSVVTSGDYQRYYIGNDGKRYHHILNPRDGYPSESGLISVSVVADKSMTADALSTMLFVAGLSKGIDLLKLFPGTDAVFVDDSLNLYVTKALKNHIQPAEGVRMSILAQ